TLIVVVLERPSIESFEITGNKDIKTEDLQKSLRNVGLATGKTFDRSVLEDVTQYLTDQYFARGKYGVKIDSHVEEEAGISVNIDEGQVYKLAQIKLAGTFVVPQRELEQLLVIHPGATFNRKLITLSQELMQNRMGRDGYAFAKVEPVPTADNANHTVSLTFFVDPGNRVYVRNISFSGANRVNDEVLRREMRQLEGGWLSNTSLERSKQRIQRL